MGVEKACHSPPDLRHPHQVPLTPNSNSLKPSCHLIDCIATTSMESSLNAPYWRLAEKTEGGYIIEVNGERHFFPEEMVLNVLAIMLARHVRRQLPGTTLKLQNPASLTLLCCIHLADNLLNLHIRLVQLVRRPHSLSRELTVTEEQSVQVQRTNSFTCNKSESNQTLELQAEFKDVYDD
ncbi:hypothetical protein BT69DRAFT_1377940 [Atractiella rhizophila]|nr:hypothetical protein BT69DRAFT_1377940 [Atractiella rhizophila]